MTAAPRLILTAFISAGMTACASSDPRPLVERVRGDSRMLTGADLALTQENTDALLRRSLTADSAAQIALANNRHLRASLEELGISQAEFALAVTPQNPSLAASWRFTSPGRQSNPEFGFTQEILDLLFHSPRKKIAERQLDQARMASDRVGLSSRFSPI